MITNNVKNLEKLPEILYTSKSAKDKNYLEFRRRHGRIRFKRNIYLILE